MSGRENGEIPYREFLFDAPLWKRFFSRYRRIFTIEEIEGNRVLQIALGGLLLSFFVTFYGWSSSSAIAVSSYLNNTYSCWPYFQNCGALYFLEPLPFGYSQGMFYTGIFAAMVAIAYLFYRREWVLSHMLLSLLWLWKFVVLFILTDQFAANYDYYDIVLLFVILFLPYKFFFARLTFVWLYFLAGTIKIHEGWILGTYFTTLQTGLPVFGDGIAPLITGIVIFMQIVGCWFLLSTRHFLQRSTFGYFFLFHLYSAILVGFRYPTVSLVMLFILFGITRSTSVIPLTLRAIFGWVLLATLLLFQLVPIVLITGDQKMTLEGNKYGLYMFEANHQCISTTTMHFKDGTSDEAQETSASARNRCDPYLYWFRYKNDCIRNSLIDRIVWTFDHSINGNPFYRIVDVPNLCNVEYQAFRHNDWIKLPTDNPEIVGYPLKNYYR